ncbi:MAG: helix-turn-helix domain-containing protein [Nanoarchaeota archaeon]|nr:helix-turn-helix domain-containing protein [Nanoarchaeota archaeon]
MNKTFIRQTVRLYPNKNQIQFLNQDIGNQRFVWNHFLAETKKLYEEEKKFLFYSNTASLLVDLKKQNEFLQIGNSQALQQTLRDFDLAVKHGYKKQKGFPRFKKKSSSGSIRLPQGCSIVDGKLKLPKIGLVKSKGSLPEVFNSVTILRKPSGKFTVGWLEWHLSEPSETNSLGKPTSTGNTYLSSIGFVQLLKFVANADKS